MDMIGRIAMRIASGGGYGWYEFKAGERYAFVDGHSVPLYYLKKRTSKSFHVIKFDKGRMHSLGDRASSLCGMIDGYLSGSGRKASGDSRFREFISWERDVTVDHAAAPLLKEMGMSLPEFQKKFHVETDFSGGGVEFTEHKFGEWRVVSENGAREAEEVEPLLREVSRRLGGTLSSRLCYGVVEVKNELPPNVLADYSPDNDSVRIRSVSSDASMVQSFIHELGHRLWDRLMGPNTKAEVKDRYEGMKDGGRIEISGVGDKAVMSNGIEFEVLSSKGRFVEVRVTDTGGRSWKGRRLSEGDVIHLDHSFSRENVRSVNGEDVSGGEDVFPSEYSKTSLEEFFSECLSHWRMGTLCPSLSDFMKKIFG